MGVVSTKKDNTSKYLVPRTEGVLKKYLPFLLF